MDGIVLVNKPQGITSHDVVARVRRIFQMRRVGHAGTLDPLATGVLVILLGKATKSFNKFQSLDKAYRATLKLGVTTHTADILGKVIEEKSCAGITQANVEAVLKRFVGDIEQTPPMVSAIKIGGKRLYKLARKGIEVERKPRAIRIDQLRLIKFTDCLVEFYVECSKGTYVRQLAEDVGRTLGCGACITQIERTKVGSFAIEQAIKLEDLNESHVQDWRG
ncbi:MAG: tRNA pseudouridine(55) synthase TruB [Omnitrophica WOR_2 bacterium RIFCSPHIGHO2_01_FULL_48_9]|nr:MAG: tRNA pseudouridine(55) synthase TruB [Omnitrophica WOR_2 bacterium RIFCSPHIGHO2_02_FULL_48_11]OGX30814.1 MAG: tRNA pseudouridine(55) synthase TruB [Omnitrophica WOR_2 bacterium RIFCSPHIGHO2_01_FULL_48_9]